MRLVLALALLSTPALADVTEVVERHVLPRIETLAATARDLSDAAAESCGADVLKPAFAEAADAWAAASHLALGPGEEGGRFRAISFWPDDKDAAGRGLRLLKAQGEDAWTSEGIARASVAARGLTALERLIYESGGETEAADCPLVQALADDLAVTTAAVRDGWAGEDGFARTLETAGEPGNTRFLSEDETTAALYTAFLTGLEFDADQRLKRPLGTFDQPRPQRAEMRRSERSLANLAASLESLREMAGLLADAPETEAALDHALDLARRLDDPAFAGVAEPSSRIRVEALYTAVEEAKATAEAEIGAALGVPAGFNSLDGD